MSMWACLNPRVFMFNGAFNTEVGAGPVIQPANCLRNSRVLVLSVICYFGERLSAA